MDIAEKIKKIEALIAGAKSDGERQAAEFAKKRLKEKIFSQPVEYAVRLDSRWKKQLFVALCKKHDLKTYRYARQKHTTAMLKVSTSFMNSVLWPEFQKHASVLDKLSQELLTDLISMIHPVVEEEETIIAGEIPLLSSFN